jgi:hypothetical protein
VVVCCCAAGGATAVSPDEESGTAGASVALGGTVSGADGLEMSADLVWAGLIGWDVEAGVVDAVVSILKSAAVGGGTLAGSGRGTAASMASSAAVLRAGS